MGLTESQVTEHNRKLQETIEKMEANDESHEAIRNVIASFNTSKQELGKANFEEEQVIENNTPEASAQDN